jgi:hypothetical protein
LAQLWKRAATYHGMSGVSPALGERLAAELPMGVEVLTERTADRGAPARRCSSSAGDPREPIA